MEGEYGDRKGVDLYNDSPMARYECAEGPLPDCMFSMDLIEVQVGYSKKVSTLTGF